MILLYFKLLHIIDSRLQINLIKINHINKINDLHLNSFTRKTSIWAHPPPKVPSGHNLIIKPYYQHHWIRMGVPHWWPKINKSLINLSARNCLKPPTKIIDHSFLITRNNVTLSNIYKQSTSDQSDLSNNGEFSILYSISWVFTRIKCTYIFVENIVLS